MKAIDFVRPNGFFNSAGFQAAVEAARGTQLERYFFTAAAMNTASFATTIATTTVASGTSCWKCDAMTFGSCASNGKMEACDNDDCCFVEVRVQNNWFANF